MYSNSDVIKRVTCHTDGCDNVDIAIELLGEFDAVICGVCDFAINDIVTLEQDPFDSEGAEGDEEPGPNRENIE